MEGGSLRKLGGCQMRWKRQGKDEFRLPNAELSPSPRRVTHSKVCKVDSFDHIPENAFRILSLGLGNREVIHQGAPGVIDTRWMVEEVFHADPVSSIEYQFANAKAVHGNKLIMIQPHAATVNFLQIPNASWVKRTAILFFLKEHTPAREFKIKS